MATPFHPPDLETVVRLGDPSKAASLNDLAVLYQFQGHHGEAEPVDE